MNNGLQEHISVFVAVAQAQSLTAASIATGIAQSTISRQLAALEKHLGVRLLQRSTRAISLTEQGEIYLRHAMRLLELNEEAEAALQEEGKLSGRMRVACSNAFGRKLLIPLLQSWQMQHPNMRMELLFADQLTHLIRERVDVAFRTAPLVESGLVARAIGISRRIVLASRAYLRKHGNVKTPEDLRKHRCILFSGAERPNIWNFDNGKRSVDVAVSGYLILSTVDALQEAVANGLGVAMTPDWFWFDNRKGIRQQLPDQIVQLLPEYRLPEQIIHAVTAKRQSTGSKTRRFVDHVQRSLDSMSTTRLRSR